MLLSATEVVLDMHWLVVIRLLAAVLAYPVAIFGKAMVIARGHLIINYLVCCAGGFGGSSTQAEGDGGGSSTVKRSSKSTKLSPGWIMNHQKQPCACPSI